MAVSATHLTHQNQPGSASSYNSASITPGANKLILAVIFTIPNSGTANIPTMTGNSLTWVQVATYTLASDSTRRITIFRAMGSSPTTGAVTFSFGGQTQFTGYWTIDQFDGVKTTGTNGSDAVVQSAENDLNTTASGITVTLSSFSNPNNATYGFLARGNGTSVTVGSGFTDLNQTTGGDGTIDTEFKATADTTVDWTWTSVNAPAQAVGVEIAIPAVPATGGGFFLL